MKSTNLEIGSMHLLSLELSHFKSLAIESFRVLRVCAFWFVTLAIVATALVAVKVWDALLFRPSPLFLRPQLRMSPGIIHINAGVQNLGWRRLRTTSHCWSWP